MQPLTEQMRLIPGADPDALIAEAKRRWQPIRTFCMFSGGDDSMVVAHRFRDQYDALYFMDTGTGVDEGPDFSVRAHVERTAKWLGKPLVVIEAGDAYEKMVLGGTIFRRGEKAGEVEAGHGFPGPGMHGKAYTRLKERCTEELLRRTKAGRSRLASVGFISGIYRDESDRRSKREPLTEKGGAKYVDPLIDWSKADMVRYRREHGLPQSDIAAILHRSGECNCGAFASAAEERPLLEAVAPRTFGRIQRLEARAEAAGLRWCRWGGYDLEGVRSNEKSDEEPGIACASCPIRGQMALTEDAP